MKRNIKPSEALVCVLHGLPVEDIAEKGKPERLVCPAGCNRETRLVGWLKTVPKAQAEKALAAFKENPTGFVAKPIPKRDKDK